MTQIIHPIHGSKVCTERCHCSLLYLLADLKPTVSNPPQALPPTLRCAPSRPSVTVTTSMFKTHPTELSASSSRQPQRIRLGTTCFTSMRGWRPCPEPELPRPRSFRPRTRYRSCMSSFKLMAATSWSI